MGRPIFLGLTVLAMCCIAAVTADAKPRPRRVAVLDFDGSPKLADAGRAAVLSVIGQEATIVPAKEWSEALERAPGHGPQRWQRASSQAAVDAVIEGWVQPEGGRNRLSIAVRDAATGAEIRTFSIAVDDRGVSTGEKQKLASQLHAILDQIEDRDHDAESAIADDKSNREAEHHEQVAAPDTSVKATDVESPVADRDPRSRFELDGGPYVAGRGMSFAHGLNGTGDLPIYPGHTAFGVAMHGNVYPLSRGDRLQSGPGVTLDLRKSLASTGSGGYTMSELVWELGAHYRLQIAATTIDLDLDGGGVAHRLVDRPASITIPSASYSYIGGGAHLEFAATDDLTLGAGGRYLYLLDIGEMGDPDRYGAGVASGVMLDGSATLNLDRRFYVRGAVDYCRVEVRFDGSGTLTQMTGRMTVVDSAIAGGLNLGVRF